MFAGVGGMPNLIDKIRSANSLFFQIGIRKPIVDCMG